MVNNVMPERAVVLAAGLGTRLKWLTRDRPKALMSVAGVPAIVRVIRMLARQGIRQVAVNTHHHAALLESVLGDGQAWGVQLLYSREQQLLDSGGGVRTALSLLSGEGAVVVHNADIMADIDLRAMAGLLPYRGCVLGMVSNPSHHSQGDFAIRQHQVGLKGSVRHTFSGVSVWDPAMLNIYDVGETFSLLQPIRQCIQQQRCMGVLHRGYWFDIGRPRDLFRAQQLFLK